MKIPLWVYITIVIVLFLSIAAFFIYRAGKKNATPPKVNYPQGGAGVPQGWDPTAIIDELYDVMSGGFTFSGTKDAAWIKLRDLATPDMVTAVYDGFNQKHFKDGNGTLTQWIRDENYYDYVSGVKASTIARLQQLNLA